MLHGAIDITKTTQPGEVVIPICYEWQWPKGKNLKGTLQQLFDTSASSALRVDYPVSSIQYPASSIDY